MVAAEIDLLQASWWLLVAFNKVFKYCVVPHDMDPKRRSSVYIPKRQRSKCLTFLSLWIRSQIQATSNTLHQFVLSSTATKRHLRRPTQRKHQTRGSKSARQVAARKQRTFKIGPPLRVLTSTKTIQDRHLSFDSDSFPIAIDTCASACMTNRKSDFVEAVKDFTHGKGVNVVLDMVSGEYVSRNLKCLAEDGRHVTIAVLGGPKADLNMVFVMMRRLTLTGSTLRPRSDSFKSALAQEIAQVAWPLFTSRELKPVMDQVFPLTEAAAAHARMEAGDHIGKIVLQVGGS